MAQELLNCLSALFTDNLRKAGGEYCASDDMVPSPICNQDTMQDSREPDFFLAECRIRPSLGQIENPVGTVAVEARSMQVLVCLARHAPHVVSKQRLIQEVWGEAFVTDEVLSHAIWELRKALRDEARNPRFIQTLAKKGYRLVAEVTFQHSPEPLTPGTRVGRYEIVEPVGSGAMGEVYRAKDLQLERAVALKFLPSDMTRDSEARRRFHHEARAIASIDHPNVATLYEAGETEGGRAYLAMAFYEGQTLEEKLAAAGTLPCEEAVAIVRQIALGLGAAHQKDIVHRDVKPANVILLPDGTVKLLDFGLAKLAGATALTRLGASPGTPAYKSPEQTRGEKVDPRSDVWALGVVLYRMLTGRVPFGGEYEQAVIYAILNEPPRPLGDGFPARLAEILDKALAKDPQARYESAAALAAALEKIPREPVALPDPPPVRHSGRRPRLLSRRAVLIALAAAVLLLTLSSAWLMWERKHRWDLSRDAAYLVKVGEDIEWRGDTDSILQNAEGKYREALALAPGNPLIEANLAALLVRRASSYRASPEQLAQIRSLVKSAVKRAPEHSMPWVAQAKLLLLEKRYDEAELAARKAIQCDPDFDRAYTLHGEALIKQNRQKEGLAKLRHATQVGPGHMRAWLALANKLYKAGKYNEAIVTYQKVLEFDSAHPTAILNLGMAYTSDGRDDDALPLLIKASETGDFVAFNNLGIVYFNLGQIENAIAAFLKAHATEPKSPSPPHGLGDCYQKLGQEKTAREWFRRAVALYDEVLSTGKPSATVLSRRAICVAKLGRTTEALGNIESALKNAGADDGEIFLRAAEVYAIAGSPDQVYRYERLAILKDTPRAEFRRDPAFRNYQNDPKFLSILKAP